MFALSKIIDDVLYAIQSDTPSEQNFSDVFSELFDRWQDPVYLEDFFHRHQKDLQNGFYGNVGIENAIYTTIDEAYAFQQKVLDIANGKNNEFSNLQEFFKPLHHNETQRYPIPDHQESKAYGGKKSWLRLYAIRLAPNLFIVTGGAIKLTRTMQERDHTQQELDKLKQVKEFLVTQNIIDSESITGFIEL